MILPLFDYSGFMVSSCNNGQKKELQQIRNNGIQTCLSSNRADHISIERMNTEINLVSLEYREQGQLLKLMYKIRKKRGLP